MASFCSSIPRNVEEIETEAAIKATTILDDFLSHIDTFKVLEIIFVAVTKAVVDVGVVDVDVARPLEDDQINAWLFENNAHCIFADVFTMYLPVAFRCPLHLIIVPKFAKIYVWSFRTCMAFKEIPRTD